MVKIDMISKIENWIFSFSDKKFYSVLLIIVLMKNGIHPIGSDWISWVYKAGQDFPEPTSYLSYSLIPVMLSKLFAFPGYLTWWVFFAILTILFYFYIYLSIRRLAGQNSKKIFIVFFSLSLAVSPLYYIGHYDLFTIFAGVLAATTRSKSVVFIAALFAVGANPEQAMITSLCVLFFAYSTNEQFSKFIARTWTVVSFVSYVLIKLLIGQGDVGSRLRIIPTQMKDVSLDSLGKLNFILFSVFGVGWIFIIIGFAVINKIKNSKLIVLSSVVVPVLFAIVILDRTRVGVAIGTLPILLFLKYISSNIQMDSISNRFFTQVLLVYLFIPQVFIDYDGTLRLPYSEFIKHFIV
jgi:hypothetical protein